MTEKNIQIDDEGNVTVTDAGEDEKGIPAQDAYGTNPESHALGGQNLIFFITLAAIV